MGEITLEMSLKVVSYSYAIMSLYTAFAVSIQEINVLHDYSSLLFTLLERSVLFIFLF